LIRRAFQDFATGRFTKDEVLRNINARGLTTRRGKPVPSQTFDAILRNPVYIAQIQVAAFGVSKRGDFAPLVTEKVFFRVHGILDGRYELTAPRQRNDPDFPLRGYVRCEACGKTLTASWSKGRSDYYAYYHCRGGCRPILGRAEAATAAGVLSERDSFDGKSLVGTGTTLPVFNHLSPISDKKRDLVDQTGASWNQIWFWLRSIETLWADEARPA
jgi:hypothetical protein